MRRHMRVKETGRAEDRPQVGWSTAEVVFDKDSQPFDGEAAVRQGIATTTEMATTTVTSKSAALDRGTTAAHVAVGSAPRALN